MCGDYFIEEGAIFYTPNKGETFRLCSEFHLVGKSNDKEGNFYHIIQYKSQYVLIAYAEVGTMEGWRKLRNFIDIPSQRKKLDLLTEYIQLHENSTEWQMPDNAGWHDENYILPTGEIIGNNQNIIFNGRIPNDKKQAFSFKGSLENWQNQIAQYALGNSRFCLLFGAAFAAPLLKFLNIEGGILHIYGESSAGKTTLQKAAQSVWGHGTHASEDWDATAYALTNVAQSLNDGLLSLDEISKDYDGNGVKRGIYALTNGKGRTRGNSTIGNLPTARFRVFGISTGETDLKTHLKKHGYEVMAGELVRCPSIPHQLESHHKFKNFRDFTNHLNQAISKYYGTAGRAYLKYLTNDLKALKKQIQEEYQNIFTDFQKKYPINDQTARTSKLFIAAILGFSLACEAKILPLDKQEGIKNIEKCFLDWLDTQPKKQSYEEDRILNQAIDFIQVNEMNFIDPDNPASLRDCPGYVKKYPREQEKEVEYYVFPKVFKEKICMGFDEKKVKELLYEKNWLEKPEENRWLVQLQGLDPISKKRMRLGRFYKFKGIEPYFGE